MRTVGCRAMQLLGWSSHPALNFCGLVMMIVGRILKLRSPSGDIEIPIRIFKPEEGKNGSWSCRYEIDWPDGKRNMIAWESIRYKR